MGLAEPGPALPRFDSSDALRQSEDPIRLSDSDLEEPSNPGQLKIHPPGGALPPPPGAGGGDVSAALANTFLAPKGGSARPAAVAVAKQPNLKSTQLGGFRASAQTSTAPKPVAARPVAARASAPPQFDDAVTVVTPPPFAAQLMPQLTPSPPPAAPRKPSVPPPPAPAPAPNFAADAPLPRFGEASTPFAAPAPAVRMPS